MSKVSVIIPTYNRADKLEYSVRSVLDQTYEDFKLIIVDDASTDNTEEAVKDLGDERVIYHRLEKNRGAGGARNEGVKIADTEYIAFQDSDDKWHPDKLERQMKYMEENPDAGMVYGRFHVISPTQDYIFPHDGVEGELEGELYPWLLRRNTVGTPTMLMKKACFEEAGGFDESLRCLEDWEFVIRFSEKFRIGFIDDALIDNLISEGSVSTNLAAYFEARCKMIAIHKAKLMELGLFDSVVMDVFGRAERSGILPQVQKMLMASLSL